MDDAMRPLAYKNPVDGFCRFHRPQSVRGENTMNKRPAVLPPSFMVFGTIYVRNNAENRGCAGTASALCREVAVRH